MSRLGIILIFLSCLFSSFTVQGQDGDNRFINAIELYDDGEYEQAIDLFNGLVEENGPSFNLFYNLGNAYYKTGETGLAILNYEKAYLLDSKDEDLNFNLKLANLHIKDKIDPLPENIFKKMWHFLIHLLEARAWGILVIFFFWLGFTGLSLYWFSHNITLRRLGFIGFFTSILIGISCLILGWSRAHSDRVNQYAIITSSSTLIKSEPNSKSTDLYLLHEGLKLRILDKVGAWVEVKLPDGNVGWTESASLSEI